MGTPKKTASFILDLLIREAVATYLVEMDMDIPKQLQDFPFHASLNTDEKTDIVRQDRGKVESTCLLVANEAKDEDDSESGTCAICRSPEYKNGGWKGGMYEVEVAKKPKTIYLPRFKPPGNGDGAAKKPEAEYKPYKPPHQRRAKDDGAVMKRQVKDSPTQNRQTAVVQSTDVSWFQELLNLDWDEKDLAVLLVRRFAPNASWPVSSLAAMQIVSKLQSARNSKSE